MNVFGKLSDEVEMANLSWRVTVWLGIESINEGLMICTDKKLTALNKMSEVASGEIHCY